LIDQVAFDQLDRIAGWEQILPKPGAQIVQHANLITPLGESLDDM
ncbi:unnamed protein product, partial [marine sediment metagenome]